MPKENALGREARLTKAASFQRVFNQAKKFRYNGISVFACRSEQACSRIGIVIPRKQVSRAVDRNRIKRIIRESFRLRNKELATQLDMVFFVYSISHDSNLEVKKCLDFLWEKLIDFCGKL